MGEFAHQVSDIILRRAPRCRSLAHGPLGQVGSGRRLGWELCFERIRKSLRRMGLR